MVQKGLNTILDQGGDIHKQVALINQIVNLIQDTTNETSFKNLTIDQTAKQLLAFLQDKDPFLASGRTAADLTRPETSIAQSSYSRGDS